MIFIVVSAVVCTILLPLVLPRQHWSRYYACYASYVTITIALSPIYIPLFSIRPRDLRNFSWCSLVAKNWSKCIGIDWQVRNGSKLKKSKNVVVVANHQSCFDAAGLLSTWDILSSCTFVAKRELWYLFPFGLAAWLAGITYIDRRKPTAAYAYLKSSAKKHFQESKEGAKIFMFPEGTRNNVGGSFLPFKKGAFRLAIELQVPVVPIVFSPYYFVQHHKDRHFTPGKMVLSVLDPIETNGLKIQDVDYLTNIVKIQMEVEFDKLRKEISLNEMNKE